MTDTPARPLEVLLGCPLCNRAPRRNGRGFRVGGVVCKGFGHLVQAYGATQAEADIAWNARPSMLAYGEECRIAAAAEQRERDAVIALQTYVVPSQALHPRYAEVANARAIKIATAIRGAGRMGGE